jgi:hypothetical protein
MNTATIGLIRTRGVTESALSDAVRTPSSPPHTYDFLPADVRAAVLEFGERLAREGAATASERQVAELRSQLTAERERLSAAVRSAEAPKATGVRWAGAGPLQPYGAASGS